MTDMPGKPVSDLLKRVNKLDLEMNAGHTHGVSHTGAEFNRVYQELGQVVSALDGNAQMGRLQGTLEELTDLHENILRHAQSPDNGLDSEEIEKIQSNLERAYQKAVKLLMQRASERV